MIYLFLQTWIWLIFSAIIGLFVGWLVCRNIGLKNFLLLEKQLEDKANDYEKLQSQNRSKTAEIERLKLDIELRNQTDGLIESGNPGKMEWTEGEVDDLKRIGGVGDSIEEILHNLGIYHYNQIAAFTQENIAWMEESLIFEGQIEREDWVNQAKQLTNGEDTEFSIRYDRGLSPLEVINTIDSTDEGKAKYTTEEELMVDDPNAGAMDETGSEDNAVVMDETDEEEEITGGIISEASSIDEVATDESSVHIYDKES